MTGAKNQKQKPETKNTGFPKGNFPFFPFPGMANSVKPFFTHPNTIEFNLPSRSPASKRSESGGWDMLVSVRVQALAEMAAKLPGGYE